MGNCFKRNSPDNSALLRNDGQDIVTTSEQPAESAIAPVLQPPAEQSFAVSRQVQTLRYAIDNVECLTEEEQIRRVKRLTLIQHLPTGIYDEDKMIRECIICMCDFEMGAVVRFLPCMHIYHRDCIDGWLIKSFTCPCCMEPVESALLATYETS